MATADVTGATVTATGPGGDTDTCSVMVSEQIAPAETLVIGPDVDVSTATYPATVTLLITSNTDGAVALASDNYRLTVSTPATVTGGVVEVEAIASEDVTGATVTASRTGISDTCTVTVVQDVIPIAIGPTQALKRGSTTASVHISGADGTVALASTPAGLVCPTSATISGGEVDVDIPIRSSGTYTITATQGVQSEACVITVPSVYVSATSYDLIRDIADVIELMRHTDGNCYHYDETLFDDAEGLDYEDRAFTIQQSQGEHAGIIGGTLFSFDVAVAYRDQPPPSDQAQLINYLNREAEWPAYVAAAYCQSAIPQMGTPVVIYQLQVQLA
jgi:hypothetical protein